MRHHHLPVAGATSKFLICGSVELGTGALVAALRGPSLLIMASALTALFLGSWLAGHRGVWGEPSDPKPSISLCPSEGVNMGGALTIRCQGLRRDRHFVLKTEGGHFLHADPDSNEAAFPLSSLRREQGGIYSCFYHSKSEPFTVSYPSDPMELVLRDLSLPRPSVSLSPTGVTAPGADVTIRCQGPRQDVRFFLHQGGDLNRPRPMDPAGDRAEFHILPVGWQHGGSYSCSYRPHTESFISSQPSYPVELVVAEGTDTAGPQQQSRPPHPAMTEPRGEAAPPGHSNFTHGNIARLVLGVGILLILGLILSEAYCSHPRGGPRSLDLATRRRESLSG